MTTHSGSGQRLPYTDPKQQGAADFYFGINATFRYIKDRFGLDGLHAYWTGLGTRYQRPVWERWRAGGLPAVAQYWRDFFAAEPGAEVAVSERPAEVVVEVSRCPAIAHLRAHDRQIVAEYCQHCVVMGNACAGQAGMAVTVAGGNGRCVQVFTLAINGASQDPSTVASCSEPRQEVN